MPVRGYHLALDWFRQGTYGGVYDDVTRAVDNNELVVEYGRETASATSRSTAGKLTFGLNNPLRVYSPENTTSPLNGRVVPGTPTRLQVTFESTIYTLHQGALDGVGADPNRAARTVSGESLDLWGQLGAEKLSTPLYRGLRTGEAIGRVLDAVGWKGPRDLDPGVTVMPWWWEEDTDAAAAVDKILASEGPPSIAYVQGDTFTFRDRHHRLRRAASQTSQGLFTHIVPAGSGPAGDFKMLRDSFSYDHGLTAISNSVSFSVDQRAARPVAEVWSSEDPLVVGSGQTVQVVAQASDPFMDAVTPQSGVDFVLSSGTVTVTLSRTSGQSTTLFVTATSGPAVVTRLAVRATPIQVARTVKVSTEDQASIGTYGRRSWPGDAGFAGADDAWAIAQRIVATYASNRPTITFSIAYVPGAPSLPARYMRQILQRRISDRISIRNDAMGLSGDYIIERITHTIRKLGLIHRVEFACQAVDPTQPSNVFTFDVAGRGFNQGAFAVDGIDNPNTMFVFDQPGQGFNQGVFAT
jgi:hypothetical protein